MTMDEIRKVERDWLLASEVAPVMGVDPQSIRVAAKAAPEKLGFPVSIIGSRLRIPKKPFIEFMEGKA